MKKLLAFLSVIIASVTLLASQAAANGSSTGTGPAAEEPTWVIPLVVLFVLICAVAAFLGARRPKRDSSF